MTAEDDFWNDPFHACALAAGFIAHAQGKLDDSEFVRQLAYALYEQQLASKERNRS